MRRSPAAAPTLAPPPMLPPHLFARADESADERFYETPRLVTHIDAGAVAAVTQLYREHFPAGGAILDLMSSWVSHLPPEVAYGRVAGLGMNGEELDANPRLTERAVQNLNTDARLPYEDDAFDGAAICVSVQYLTRPVALFRDAARVLRPGAPLVVTFSNRCFPSKAVAVWQSLDARGQAALVMHYCDEAARWVDVRAYDRSPSAGDPLYAVVARSAASP